VRLDLPRERWRRLLAVMGAPWPELPGAGAVVGAVSQTVSIPASVAETVTDPGFPPEFDPDRA
jgi:hypothetical protein